jgi:hypothetical protein
MPFQVIDANGNLLEVEDGQPIPSGCRLHVPMTMLDSATRELLDDLKRRYPAKAASDQDGQDDQDDDEEPDDQDDGGDDQDDGDGHRDNDPEMIRAAAYYSFRNRIDTANNRRRKVPQAPAPRDPSWQSSGRWKPRGRYGNDAASLAEAEGRRAAAYVDFKLRIDTANVNRRGRPPASPPSSPPAADDAATSERRANLERLQRAYARR